jgi:hypothetical protein
VYWLRVFLDAEFTDFIECQLIPVGLVTEAGTEFYAELPDFDTSICSDFTQAAALPQLGGQVSIRGDEAAVGSAVSSWLHNQGEHIDVLGSYMMDWELLCYLVRDPATLALPAWISWQNISHLVEQRALWHYHRASSNTSHHALHDARALRSAFLFA